MIWKRYSQNLYENTRIGVNQLARINDSSGNTVVWTDYLMTSVQNQDQIFLPANSYSNKVYYDDRLIISALRDNPICWEVSKIEDTHPMGINKVTLIQVKFDQNVDFIDWENEEMWGNYFSDKTSKTDTTVVPEPEPEKIVASINTGDEYNIRNGYSRTLTIETENYDIDYDNLEWTFSINSSRYTEEKQYITRIVCDTPNQLKIKLIKDLRLVGSIITVHVTDGAKLDTSIELEVK